MAPDTPYGQPGQPGDTNARLAVLESTMAATTHQLERVEHEMDTRFDGIASRLEGAMAEMRAGAAEGRKVLTAIMAGVIGTLITTIIGILIATA